MDKKKLSAWMKKNEKLKKQDSLATSTRAAFSNWVPGAGSGASTPKTISTASIRPQGLPKMSPVGASAMRTAFRKSQIIDDLSEWLAKAIPEDSPSFNQPKVTGSIWYNRKNGSRSSF